MIIPGVKALTFDVGGTVFDWRGTIEAELRDISEEQGIELDARQFASDWRGEVQHYISNGAYRVSDADVIYA